MSAIIRWRPVKDAKSLAVYAPQTFMENIEKVFGSFPVVIGHGDDMTSVKAMEAMFTGKDKYNPYKDLRELLDKYGVIEIWAEY